MKGRVTRPGEIHQSVTDFDEYVPYAANVSVFQEPVAGYSLDEYIQSIKKAAQRDLGEYRVIRRREGED